jgi:predicted transcriptional regulator
MLTVYNKQGCKDTLRIANSREGLLEALSLLKKRCDEIGMRNTDLEYLTGINHANLYKIWKGGYGCNLTNVARIASAVGMRVEIK